MTAFRLASDADRPAWDAFIATRPDADPLQSWAWGEANATVGEVPLRCLVEGDGGGITAVAQVLVRAAGLGRSVAYIPHGPVWDRSAEDADGTLEMLLRGVRDEARTRGVIVVKLDPRSGDGGPGPIRDRLDRSSLRRARHDLQAPTTRIVELLDGGDALMATWDKDARNLVRRSAREGVDTDVDTGGSPDAIRAFHELLMETSRRAGFRVRPESFLATLAHELARDRGWYLTLARHDDRPIAGAVALRTGSRAIYAYGASLREPALKHTHGAYACLAATMRTLATDGVDTLDLWGVVEPDDEAPDASWTGFSAFKRQFGGTPLRHPGTFDLVVDPLWYRIRDIRERVGERIRRR